ncbi:YceI family protein [Herbaspirillum sp. RTI4]|uniref:YceI family protein n=1 Tax=Herbaspirillum sp. RTI4 TaxID=3048640 RepID=UPI002AB596D9|nr:YceI family protein [Herbaspirillum sp. RTI4]MDY7576785.1 YceI family protein [Herbaspirillum sp. RTI4]MEA9981381.1 YceI family protein [Herbaspirillum sp. RTI4]
MHITSALRSLSLAVCLTTLFATAHAAPLKTDTAKSSVLITFKQLNVPVDATFKSFDARIDFDATKPALGKASIDINIASFDLGEAEYNKEVMKKDWFNTAQFPKANFISSSIKPSTPGKFDVTGKLTIKGKTSEVHFPLTVNKTGANQVFDGTLPIKRLTYNIGEGEWKDTGMVADEVLIKFHIVAQ